MTLFSVLIRAPVVVLMSGVLLTSVARAADVTVSVSGAVKDSTCTVPAPALTLVNMGRNNDINTYQQKGNTGEPVRFVLKLENCGAQAQGVSVTFHGVPDADNSAVLALDAFPDSATGIGVQLMSSVSDPLSLGDAAPVQTLTPGNDAELPFWVRYIATRNNATAGRAWATATIDFTYS